VGLGKFLQPQRETYLVYLPGGGETVVDLSTASGTFLLEWMNPTTEITTTGETVSAGAQRQMKVPLSGDAVLYLKRR
jgi:hypothetical protein